MSAANGSGRAAPARLRGGAVVGAVMLLMAGCASAAGPAPSTEPSFGELPTFLGSGTAQVDSVLTGSTARPALSAQGEAVQVQLDTGAVRVTVVGPDVPGEGLPKVTETTTCTWTITMTGATAAIGLSIGDFTSRDHLGLVYRPKLVPGQPVPPAQVLPGQTVTFELRAIMRTGEGLMTWAPGGALPVAAWDFVVEND